jgi:molybdopterin-guanine dinucleotide biosynthesis protein A
MGHADKGWVEWLGMPLIEHAIRSVEGQVASIIISVNRNVDRYAALGHMVVQDADASFSGPLAGMQAALKACKTSLLITLPVDTQGVPAGYVARMLAPLNQSGAGAVVAISHENRPDGGYELRDQWTHLLLRKSVLPHLSDAIERGERKVQRFIEHAAVQAQFATSRVDFLRPRDATHFRNFNSQADLAG